MNCPDENQLAALAQGDLDDESLAGLSAHLGSCGDCRELVVALGSGGLALAIEPMLVGTDPLLGPMQSLGRFEIEAELGRGAMGVVHQATDPTLNRRVALKVVRGPFRLRAGARERLLQEARSLARLTHANVVPIYEAGVEDDELYIAMELIDGKPLSDWLRDKERGWREIVRVFAAAGDGLAAAHASDLVHRDFKPANVMVSDSDALTPVVKVVDFGLARTALFVESDSVEVSDAPLDADRLTITGTFVGTPAYAAPEQMSGLEVTPASDLFSFCVALFEALTGERPFAGRTRDELLAAIRLGPSKLMLRQIPRRLRTVVAAGLRYNASERPSSMVVVTTALRSSLKRRGGRQLAALLGAVLIGGVVTGGLILRADQEEPPCSTFARQLDGVWDRATQVAVSRSLLEAGAGLGPERSKTVSRVLGEYSRRWLSGRTSACKATVVAGEQSAELLDRRVACFRRTLGSFRAVTDILRAADFETVKTSIDLATGLPSLDECDDTERLLARERDPAIDPVARDAVESLIAQANAHSQAGQSGLGLELAEKAAKQAAALKHNGLTWRASEVLAALEVNAGRFDRGVAAYRAGLFAAVAAGDADAEARLAADLARELTSSLIDYPLAESFAEHARAALGRVRSSESRADALIGLASYYESTRELEHADLAVLDAALAAKASNSRRGADLHAAALFVKGELAFRRGEPVAARAAFEESLEIRVREYGHNHRLVADSHEALAHTLSLEFDEEASVAEAKKAWAIRETLAGEVNEYKRLGVEILVTDNAKSLEHLTQRQVEVSVALFGKSHPNTASALLTHAHALVDVEAWDKTIAAAKRALELLGKAGDARAQMLLHIIISDAHRGAGRLDEGAKAAQRARAIMDGATDVPALDRLAVVLTVIEALIDTETWNQACSALDELVADKELIEVFVAAEPTARKGIALIEEMCAWEVRSEREALARFESGLEELRAGLGEDAADYDEWLRRSKKRARRGKKR